jgi:hypothetical protein
MGARDLGFLQPRLQGARNIGGGKLKEKLRTSLPGKMALEDEEGRGGNMLTEREEMGATWWKCIACDCTNDFVANCTEDHVHLDMAPGSDIAASCAFLKL